ncbi:hypothetical protein BH11BAC6_BH11BAC6_12840 [soil metagenome]
MYPAFVLMATSLRRTLVQGDCLPTRGRVSVS